MSGRGTRCRTGTSPVIGEDVHTLEHPERPKIFGIDQISQVARELSSFSGRICIYLHKIRSCDWGVGFIRHVKEGSRLNNS